MVATLIFSLRNLQEGVCISLRMDLKDTSKKIQKERTKHHTNHNDIHSLSYVNLTDFITCSMLIIQGKQYTMYCITAILRKLRFDRCLQKSRIADVYVKTVQKR